MPLVNAKRKKYWVWRWRQPKNTRTAAQHTPNHTRTLQCILTMRGSHSKYNQFLVLPNNTQCHLWAIHFTIYCVVRFSIALSLPNYPLYHRRCTLAVWLYNANKQTVGQKRQKKYTSFLLIMIKNFQKLISWGDYWTICINLVCVCVGVCAQSFYCRRGRWCGQADKHERCCGRMKSRGAVVAM